MLKNTEVMCLRKKKKGGGGVVESTAGSCIVFWVTLWLHKLLRCKGLNFWAL